jgi:hypothetical protein
MVGDQPSCRGPGDTQVAAVAPRGLLAGGALLVNEATFDAAGLPVPPPNYVSRPSNLMLVEIPANFQAIKRQSLPWPNAGAPTPATSSRVCSTPASW